MYWNRSQFFLIANTTLFGFTANVTRGDLGALSVSQRATLLILSFAGIGLTSMWFRVLEAGKRWMDYFKGVCESLEQDAFGDIRVMRASRDRSNTSAPLEWPGRPPSYSSFCGSEPLLGPSSARFQTDHHRILTSEEVCTESLPVPPEAVA